MHVYRWDLDKTYLETDFESFRGLVRSAIENAEDKRAVPGATALLKALAEPPDNRVFILSGSPTQLRAVLEEKLRLDGIRHEGLTLKDSFGHLRRGNVRAIKEQFGYKLPLLLLGRAGLQDAAHETLFGDDVEVDALVYSLYADALAGRASSNDVSRVMHLAGALPEAIDTTLDALARLPKNDAVDRIFIRLERRRPPHAFAPLGPRCVPVHSWWQAALVLHGAGHIDGVAAGRVMAQVATGRGRGPWEMAALTQDIVRRGHVLAEALDTVVAPAPLLAACREALLRMGEGPPPSAPPEPEGPVDYLALVRGWRERG